MNEGAAIASKIYQLTFPYTGTNFLFKLLQCPQTPPYCASSKSKRKVNKTEMSNYRAMQSRSNQSRAVRQNPPHSGCFRNDNHKHSGTSHWQHSIIYSKCGASGFRLLLLLSFVTVQLTLAHVLSEEERRWWSCLTRWEIARLIITMITWHHYGWVSRYFVNVNKHHFQESIAANKQVRRKHRTKNDEYFYRPMSLEAARNPMPIDNCCMVNAAAPFMAANGDWLIRYP